MGSSSADSSASAGRRPHHSRSDVAAAVARVRNLVAADGGDVELVEAGETTLTLRLILDGAECRECVMPASYLESMILPLLQIDFPEITSVTIQDPRH